MLAFFEKEIEKIIIKNIIEKDYRPDGRNSKEISPLTCEVAVLPRAHGSGVFFRGLTRVLSILTLGGPGDSQILEGMEVVGKKRFMHHYNFPPFSSGETAPMRGPKRREIGHGALVEKALLPMLPEVEKFPYTIRIVSEVVSSNGSTSQASVCAACIALMDAGVPIKEPVAGISIGLAKDEESGKYKVLTDIQGPEDHYGDMDFKVAGTRNGITAIQMDIKIDGIDKVIMEEALDRAKDARLKILDIIKEQIPEPRKELSPYAPKIISFMISPSKIGEVVGPRGSVINKIIEECNGIAIDIEDSGLVAVTGQNQALKNAASVLDEYITNTLKKPSNVVNNWIDALLLQKVSYKSDSPVCHSSVSTNVSSNNISKENVTLNSFQGLTNNAIPGTSEQTDDVKQHDDVVQNSTNSIQNSKLNAKLEELYKKAAKIADSGNLDKALYIRKTYPCFSETNNTNIQTRLYMDKAYIHDVNGDFANALENYNNAANLAFQTGNQQIQAKAHYNMGSIYDDCGKNQNCTGTSL